MKRRVYGGKGRPKKKVRFNEPTPGLDALMHVLDEPMQAARGAARVIGNWRNAARYVNTHWRDPRSRASLLLERSSMRRRRSLSRRMRRPVRRRRVIARRKNVKTLVKASRATVFKKDKKHKRFLARRYKRKIGFKLAVKQTIMKSQAQLYRDVRYERLGTIPVGGRLVRDNMRMFEHSYALTVGGSGNIDIGLGTLANYVVRRDTAFAAAPTEPAENWVQNVHLNYMMIPNSSGSSAVSSVPFKAYLFNPKMWMKIRNNDYWQVTVRMYCFKALQDIIYINANDDHMPLHMAFSSLYGNTAGAGSVYLQGSSNVHTTTFQTVANIQSTNASDNKRIRNRYWKLKDYKCHRLNPGDEFAMELKHKYRVFSSQALHFAHIIAGANGCWAMKGDLICCVIVEGGIGHSDTDNTKVSTLGDVAQPQGIDMEIRREWQCYIDYVNIGSMYNHYTQTKTLPSDNDQYQQMPAMSARNT